MTVPLVILAVFAVLLGLVGTPAWPWFDGFLNGEPAQFNFSKLTESGTLGLMLASAVIVFSGLGLGWWLYGKRQRQTAEEPMCCRSRNPPFSGCWRTNISWTKFTRRPLSVSMLGRRASDFLDRWIWGGMVLLVAWVTLGLSRLYQFADDFVVNLGFDTGCETLREGGGEISSWHSGRVQSYLRVIGVALVVLVLFLIWGHKS